MTTRRTTKKNNGLQVSVKIKGGTITLGPKQILAAFVAGAGLFGMHGASARESAATAAPQAIVQSAPQQTAQPIIIVVNQNGTSSFSQAQVDSLVKTASRPAAQAKVNGATPK